MTSKHILLIQGHPDADAPHLCHALAASYPTGAHEAGHRMRWLNVAELDFPLLRSQKAWEDIVAPGGTVANVGAHGVKVDLHLEKLWSHNVTITTGLVDTFSIPMLLKTVQSKRINAKQLITHHFKLGEIMQAYDTFSKAAGTKALKVIIEA